MPTEEKVHQVLQISERRWVVIRRRLPSSTHFKIVTKKIPNQKQANECAACLEGYEDAGYVFQMLNVTIEEAQEKINYYKRFKL